MRINRTPTTKETLKCVTLFLVMMFLVFSPSLTVLGKQSSQRTKHYTKTKVVNEFLLYHHSRKEKLTLQALRQRKRWLSPVFYKWLRLWLIEKNKSNDPLEEQTDVFSDAQRYPYKHEVGKVERIKGVYWGVEVTFFWDDDLYGKDSSTETFLVRKYGNRWLIENVVGENQEDILSQLIWELEEMKKKQK